MDIYTFCVSSVIVITGLFLVFSGLWMLHLEVASRQRTKVLNAIFVYMVDTVINHHKNTLVEIHDMEPFAVGIDRWWDWGYKNILPPDKLTIIEPYIPLVSSRDGFENMLKGHTISSIDDIAKILRGGIEPMESKNINNTQKVTSFDDIIPINDRPEPIDKMDKFDPDHKV